MNKKGIIGILFILVLFLPLIACNDDGPNESAINFENNDKESQNSGNDNTGNENPEIDGNWSPMEWEEESIAGDIEINFYSSGITYVNVKGTGVIELACTNYDGFWFDYGNYYPEQPESIYRYKKQWCELSIEGNIIQCKFLEMKPYYDREIQVVVTAGDIFNTFYFIRK